MLNGKNSTFLSKNSVKNLRISKNSSTFALGKQKQLTIKTITIMKDFSNTPVSEIAKMAYSIACENAEQVVNTVNDHGDNDPRYERKERTQEWECMIMTDAICGMKLFIDANFTCPTPSEIFDKESCHYFRIEYRGTAPEQDDIFNAYMDALYYELQKIVGDDCDLCVE